MNKIDQQQLILEIKAVDTTTSLDAIRAKIMGRNGIVTTLLREIGSLPKAERQSAGEYANKIRIAIQESLEQQLKIINNKSGSNNIQNYVVDLTAPRTKVIGHIHPVSAILEEAIQIFWQMGYSIADGPEIETEWYNFEALNIDADHPARDMQDTFYLKGGNLPRTHTSGMEIRYMENNRPPIRMIAPGKVYRNEDEDARHIWMFHQIEGLVVDKDVSIADLKGTLSIMMRGLIGDKTEIRLRPSFFPYTEPSMELDATCVVCSGKGCKMCSNTGWLELGGAGMVHPRVLKNVGIDPTKYSGFAFGFGLERIAAIKFGVPDVREFWRPNLEFLEQF